MSVGIDIVEVERIAKSLGRGKFLERIYTVREREYLAAKKYNPQSAAGLFAAKEAFSKAMGTGMRGFSFSDIEVLHTEAGAPYLRLYGGALKAAGEMVLSLSISHTDRYAAAVVDVKEP